jgi:hypothetical protein
MDVTVKEHWYQFSHVGSDSALRGVFVGLGPSRFLTRRASLRPGFDSESSNYHGHPSSSKTIQTASG